MITREHRIKGPHDKTCADPFEHFNTKELMLKQSKGKALTREEKNYILLKAEQTRKQRLN